MVRVIPYFRLPVFLLRDPQYLTSLITPDLSERPEQVLRERGRRPELGRRFLRAGEFGMLDVVPILRHAFIERFSNLLAIV